MIKNIFETKIYEVMMPEFDNIKQQVIDTVLPLFKETSQHKHIGNGQSCFWDVDGKLHDVVDLTPITDFVTEHARIFWKDLGYANSDRLRIYDSWANVMPEHGQALYHHHRPCPLVGSFYIHATTGTGNLFIEHPLNSLLAYQPFAPDMTDSYNNFYEIEAVSGKLVLFPGYLNHFTKKNITEENRLGLAFNFMNI